MEADFNIDAAFDEGSDGHMTIYELATAALVDQKPDFNITEIKQEVV